MILMTLRDLQYRAKRVALVTLLVALVLTLLYLMTGLVNQLQTEPHRAVDGIGASTWVLADEVAGPFTAASALPLAAIDQLRGATSGDIEPIVVSRGAMRTPPGSAEGVEVQMIGHVVGALGQPAITAGAPIADAGDIVVDDSLRVAVGAEVQIGVDRFTVTGLTSNSTVLAGQGLVFTDLATAQRLTFQNDEVVTGFVATGSVADSPGFSVVSATAVADETLGPIESAVASIDLIRVLLWFVAAIVMGAVIYLTALERQRDFAVLKAVGSSGRSLAVGLALQAALIALLAAVVGAILGKLIEPSFPLPVRIPASALITVPAIAVVVGLVSAVAGVRRVNRTDPAEAFS